jgi:prepilin signal peptidase PulO-like enzyme (type II secretory pathway)
LVELLTGILFGLSPLFFSFGTLIWLKGLICGFALIVLFFTDLTEYILPDAVQFPLMALGLLFTIPQMLMSDVSVTVASFEAGGNITANLFNNALQTAPLWTRCGENVSIGNSLIGLVAGYVLPWAFNFAYVKIRNAIASRLSGKEPLESGMGMGDFKMLAWLGAFWGWGPMLGILFVAVLIMCIFGMPTHFMRRRDGNTMYPLGCGLALATPIVVFWGSWLWNVYQTIL